MFTATAVHLATLNSIDLVLDSKYRHCLTWTAETSSQRCETYITKLYLSTNLTLGYKYEKYLTQATGISFQGS